MLGAQIAVAVPENWMLSLLNGIVGSILAGLVAGAVAMTVLVITNRAQAKLAAEALEEQRRLSADALDAQRRIASEALAEQRKLSISETIAAEARAQKSLNAQLGRLELQLKDQRFEAAKAREHAAIAEMLSGAMRLSQAQDSSQGDLSDAYSTMRSAALRWGLESDSSAMSLEVVTWVFAFFTQAVDAFQADHSKSPASKDVHGILRSTYSIFMNIWTEYPTASANTREENWEWMRAAVADPKPRSAEQMGALRVKAARIVWRKRQSEKGPTVG